MKKVKLHFDYAEFKTGDIIEVPDTTFDEMVNKYKCASAYDTESNQQETNQLEDSDDQQAKDVEAMIEKRLDAERTVSNEKYATLEKRLFEQKKNENPKVKAYNQLKQFGSLLQSLIPEGQRKTLNIKAPTGIGETVDADGGFLVDLEFQIELDRRVYDESLLLGKVRHRPIGDNFNGLRYNERVDYNRTDGNHSVNVSRVAEADLKPASVPTFAQRTLDLEKLVGFYFATDEILQDRVGLASDVAEWFGEEFAYKNDFEIIRGTGVGQMLGILDAGNTARVDITRTLINEVQTDDVTNMFAAMWGRSKGNADWYINSSVWPQLLTMTIGNQPIFIAPGALPEAPSGMLLGRPVIELEMASGLNGLGDIMFLDLNQYRVIEKGGIDSASSIHVRFQNNETTFRFEMRNNGAPIWTATITPNQAGGSVQSPYVALDTLP